MKTIMHMLRVLVSGVLIVQLAGCGTLMHPERRGQRGGRIDVGIAALDGIGLLFFLIPGLIAFAVDFSEGTIYLPGGASSSLDRNDMKIATFDPKYSTAATIEEIIRKETGHRIKLNQANMKISRLESLEEMRTHFAEALPSGRTIRVAGTTN